jgi:L-rhamnonate dehydratase
MAFPAVAFQSERSWLKIAGVRLVRTRPKRRGGGQPHADLLGIQGATLAVYAGGGKLGGYTVEIATDQEVTGYGSGGTGVRAVVEGHFAKLLVGEDPFIVERIWDVIGVALGLPVYRLLDGETKRRVQACGTGNDTAQYLQFGFKRFKVAMRYGPADGVIGDPVFLDTN